MQSRIEIVSWTGERGCAFLSAQSTIYYYTITHIQSPNPRAVLAPPMLDNKTRFLLPPRSVRSETNTSSSISHKSINGSSTLCGCGAACGAEGKLSGP